MPDKLKNRSAVVTGAGRGIGRAVALLLAQEGANVVVNDPGVNVDGTGHDAGPADVGPRRNQRPPAATPSPTTTTSRPPQGGENMVRQCVDAFGRIDILINVAGILRDRMIFNMAEDEWDAVINVHLKGHFNTIKPASQLMRQQRYGRIVNFSSISGLRGNSGQANYGAAKAGIAGLTRVVARDLGRYGVTTNCIAPGAFTRMVAQVPDTTRQLRAARGMAPTAQLRQPPDRDDRRARRPDDRLALHRRRLERQRQDLPRLRRHRLPRPRRDAHPPDHEGGRQVDGGGAAVPGARTSSWRESRTRRRRRRIWRCRGGRCRRPVKLRHP